MLSGDNIFRMKSIGVLLAVLMVAGWAPSQDSRHMSQEEYDKLAAAALQELKDNPEKIIKASKAVLAKTAKLNASDELMDVFDVDPIFTVESMLLLLATNNEIKKSEDFISDFTEKTRGVSQKLKKKSQLAFLAVMAGKLVAENRKIPSKPFP